MILHGTLSRYFGRHFAFWFLSFLFGLSGIVYLFEVAELLRRAANRPEAGLGLILRMGIYKLPETVEHILPFVVLFSGMFVFWRLTRSNELAVARAAGISAWQFLAPALGVTFLFGFLNTTIINPLGASFNEQYQRLDSHYLQRAPTLELTGAGLWLRQQDDTRRYLLHADHVQLDPLVLTPLIAFVYDRKGHYLGRIDAPKATLQHGEWKIEDVWFNWDQQDPQHQDVHFLSTNLTFNKIQESMSPPNTISFWRLPHFISALKAIGLPATRHELHFQELLARPVLLCAMVFFAAAFSLRLSRWGGMAGMSAAGVAVGSGVFTLNNVVTALGANQTLPVLLAAWAIPVVMFALGNAALLYMEDG